MRSRVTTLTLALATALALHSASAADIYLHVPHHHDHHTPEAAAEQLHQRTSHPVTVTHHPRSIEGFANLTLHTYDASLLIGPLTPDDADALAADLDPYTRIDLKHHTLSLSIDLGRYRSQSSANRVAYTLDTLGEPTQRHHHDSATSIHAGPYPTPQHATAALERIRPFLSDVTPRITFTLTIAEAPADEPTSEPHALQPEPEPVAFAAAVSDPEAEPEASFASRLDVDLGAYLHVRSHTALAVIEQQRLVLDELGVPSVTLQVGERYRLFAGPLAPSDSDATAQRLRQHGIATYLAADALGAPPARASSHDTTPTDATTEPLEPDATLEDAPLADVTPEAAPVAAPHGDAAAETGTEPLPSRAETDTSAADTTSASAETPEPEPVTGPSLDLSSVEPRIETVSTDAAALDASEPITLEHEPLQPAPGASVGELGPLDAVAQLEPLPEVSELGGAPISEPAPEPVIAPAAEIPAEPVEEATVEPVIEPVAETPAKPVAEASLEPTVEPAAEIPAEPVEEATVEPVIEPAAEIPAEPSEEATTEPASDAQANTDPGAASDADLTPDASAPDTTSSDTNDALEPPAPEPLAGTPTLAANDLPDGMHLRVQSARAPAQLAPERDILADLGYPSVVVPLGARYSLVAGPIPSDELDDLRITLRSHGIASTITGNPNYLATHDHRPRTTTSEPRTSIALHDPTTLQHPHNYLLLTPNPDTPDALHHLDPNTFADLITTTDPHHDHPITLLGPIPNDQLEPIAASLGLHGSITTYPMPTLEHGASSEAWAALGYRLITLNAPHEARSAFLEARAIDVGDYDALFGLALSEDLLGNDDAAEFAYAHVLSLHPERFDARYNYALRTLHAHGPQASLQHHLDALAIAQTTTDPEQLTLAHLALAHNLTLINDHTAAATHYQATFDLTSNLDHLILRLDAQRAQGIHLPLLPELTALERDTHDIRFTRLISSIYLTHDQHDYALDSLERRLRTSTPSDHPHDLADLLNTIASIHVSQGHTDRATTALEDAAALAPDHAPTRYNQALLQLAQGDTRAAIHDLHDALALGLDDPLAYLDLAEASRRIHDHPSTIDATHEALQRISDTTARAHALTLKIEAELALGLRTAAHHSAQALLELRPDDPHALTLAGAAAHAAEHYATAAEHLLSAYRLTGDHQRRHPLARALLAANRYREARDLYIELALERPTDADIAHELGWAHLRLGDHDAARNAWTDASSLGHQAASHDLSSVFGESPPAP